MGQNTFNQTHDDIVSWIKALKFKKKLIGGVDEEDVFKKIDELNRLYEAALLNERARYDALLSAQTQGGKDDDGT